MIVAPVARSSVADAVYAQLRDAIVDDVQPAGSLLPAERELSEQAGVNRQAIREALQRLREANLVTIVHGGGVRVRDWRRTADLALLPEIVVAADGRFRREPALAMLRFRTVLGIDASRLAAQRIDDAGAELMRERVAESIVLHDAGALAVQMIESYEHVWAAVVDASHNIAYRLLNNSFQATAAQFATLFPATVTAPRSATEQYVALVDRIVARDAAGAAAAAEVALDLAERVLRGVIANG